MTVNDPLLGKNRPFEVLQHSDNQFYQAILMYTPGNGELVLLVIDLLGASPPKGNRTHNVSFVHT